MRKKIIIVGAFHEIIELAKKNKVKILGLIDNLKVNEYYNYPIIGNDYDIIKISKKFKSVPLLISPDNPLIRKKLYEEFEKEGFEFASLVSSDSTISNSSFIGKGTIIQIGVNVSSETIIGKFVKLNTMCNLMHNVIIGDFTTIAPNAVILGNVTIGKFCYIGANATVLPNLKICDNTIIGAGSVVSKEINVPGKYIGSPVRIIK